MKILAEQLPHFIRRLHLAFVRRAAPFLAVLARSLTACSGGKRLAGTGVGRFAAVHFCRNAHAGNKDAPVEHGQHLVRMFLGYFNNAETLVDVDGADVAAGNAGFALVLSATG